MRSVYQPQQRDADRRRRRHGGDACCRCSRSAFGGWNGRRRGAASCRAGGAAADARGRSTIVDKPGAEQSQIRIGWVGVARSTPDYFALEVLNTMLGGSFTSRLNQNLRETARLLVRRQLAVRHAAVAGAVLRRAPACRPTRRRSRCGVLQGARRHSQADRGGRAREGQELSRRSGFPSEFETIDDLAANLEELAIYGLPERYYADYVANIDGVTAAAVQRAAATHIEPGNLAVVVVGDRARIEAGIRALNLGEVRILGVEDVLP